MEAKYKVGEMILLNLDNEIVDAKIFGVIENNLEKEPFYSIEFKGKFIFIEESRVIKVPNE
jgi:hypothetical protein